MAEKEKSPEEKGREAADAMMAGAGHVLEEGVKSIWWLGKWGCIGYAIYFVIGSIIAFVVFALRDFPWLVVVVIVIALVIYFATRKSDPPPT